MKSFAPLPVNAKLSQAVSFYKMHFLGFAAAFASTALAASCDVVTYVRSDSLCFGQFCYQRYHIRGEADLN